MRPAVVLQVLAGAGLIGVLLWRAHDVAKPEPADRGAILERQIAADVRRALADAGSAPSDAAAADDAAAAVTLDLEAMIHRVVEGGLEGNISPGDRVDAGELETLTAPPFVGSKLKTFHWLPHWPRPHAFTYWSEGTAGVDDVVAYYLAVAKKTDPDAVVTHPTPSWWMLRSTRAALDADITLYEDGKTVSAQVSYGGT